jgi:hypothetical protein
MGPDTAPLSTSSGKLPCQESYYCVLLIFGFPFQYCTHCQRGLQWGAVGVARGSVHSVINGHLHSAFCSLSFHPCLLSWQPKTFFSYSLSFTYKNNEITSSPSIICRLMSSTTPPPILPILTTRVRHYGPTSFRHPTLTIRQRFTPYTNRRTTPSPTTWVFPTIARLLDHRPSSPNADGNNPPCDVTPKTLARYVFISHYFFQHPSELPTSTKVDRVPVIQDDGLVPKPPGEVGRKGPQGYLLEHALQWSSDDVKRLRVGGQRKNLPLSAQRASH